MRIDVASILNAYPNNAFSSYWQKAKKMTPFRSKFWRIVYAIFRLAGSIARDAGIELLCVLIFWLIITQMSQGRDLIVSLFEPDGIYTKNRVLITVLTAVSLSVSMWIIPAFIFQGRDKKNNCHGTTKSGFKKHLFFAHRILPLVPFWLLASVFFNQAGMRWLFFGLSILQLFSFHWFYEIVLKGKGRLVFGTVMGVLLLLSILYFGKIYKTEYTQAKIALSIILYLIAYVLHFLYYEGDLALLQENYQASKVGRTSFGRYRWNSIAYLVLIGMHLFFVILLFGDVRTPVAPESIMLYIFSVYVFVIDLVAYAANHTPRIKFIVGVCTGALILCMIISPAIGLNLHHYTLDAIKDTSVLLGKKRLSFEDRYNLLKAQIDSNKSGKPFPIILISGEGGGSRGGLWFSQNLINFDYYTKGRFRQHVFSLSTVSGSSVGLSTVFAFWESTAPDRIDSTWLDFPLEVYSNNFVGGSVKALLLTDLWKTLTPFLEFESDRNSLLQEEEAYATHMATQKIIQGKPFNENESHADSAELLRRDFMDFFYEFNGSAIQFRKQRPLAFINSCRGNDGRRGIISPVLLTDDVFNDAIDIAGYIYEDSVCNYKNEKLCQGRKRNISLGQACNLSELFPLFSAPAYIDSLGSFVDGGYHENSGLKTTLDVYFKLKRALESKATKPSGKYEIYIIYLKNGSGTKDLYKSFSPEIPLAIPIKALSSQPFEGSASYFEERARFIVDTLDTLSNTKFISLQLDNKIIKELNDSTVTQTGNSKRIQEQILADLRTEKNSSTLSFPLARWLSKSVIRRIRLASNNFTERQRFYNLEIHNLLKNINQVNHVSEASLKPFDSWTPYTKGR